MAFSQRTVFSLGPAYADSLADLSVKLVDDGGTTIATVTTGFRNCGDGSQGTFSWKYAAFPDDFSGDADLYVDNVYTGVSASINARESGLVDLWSVRGNALSSTAGSNFLTYYGNGNTPSTVLISDYASVGGFLGSDISESAAGYLAAGFSYFFNVATPEQTMNSAGDSEAIAAAVVEALTAAGVLDDAGLQGEQVTEHFTGEDVADAVTLTGDLSAATFSWTLARSLADALAGSGIVNVVDADITVSGQTVTVPATETTSASLPAGEYWRALRRTDVGSRWVPKWGKWIVTGA